MEGGLSEDDWRILSRRVTRQCIRFSIELGCKQVSCLNTSGLMWIICGEDNYICLQIDWRRWLRGRPGGLVEGWRPGS